MVNPRLACGVARQGGGIATSRSRRRGWAGSSVVGRKRRAPRRGQRATDLCRSTGTGDPRRSATLPPPC